MLILLSVINIFISGYILYKNRKSFTKKSTIIEIFAIISLIIAGAFVYTEVAKLFNLPL